MRFEPNPLSLRRDSDTAQILLSDFSWVILSEQKFLDEKMYFCNFWLTVDWIPRLYTYRNLRDRSKRNGDKEGLEE